MGSRPIAVRRLRVRLRGDPARTIVRFFWPGGEERARRIIGRVLALDDAAADALLGATMAELAQHHADLDDVLTYHFEQAVERAGADADQTRRLLIGAYFTMEYAFESAALVNPSMGPAVDQDEAPAGALRFAMSLRAVGEGHVSSVVFRRGIATADGDVAVEKPGRSCRAVRRGAEGVHHAAAFRADLTDRYGDDPVLNLVLSELPDLFTTGQLREAVGRLRPAAEDVSRFNTLTEDIVRQEEGWLLLTHGVGPMRRYCMGAILLDLRDPSRVIGRLTRPLLVPEADELAGYVPNVVYSCGGLIHNRRLIIPYGISDAATGFAVVALDDVLNALVG